MPDMNDEIEEKAEKVTQLMFAAEHELRLLSDDSMDLIFGHGAGLVTAYTKHKNNALCAMSGFLVSLGLCAMDKEQERRELLKASKDN